MDKRLAGAALAITAALLASCGDDLESRNDAVMEGRPEQGGVTIRQEPRAPSAQETSGGFDEQEADIGQRDGDDVVVDAEPESLIDRTEGFAAEPMDDASGFDPAPTGDDDWGEVE